MAGLAKSTFFYHQARTPRPDPQAQLRQAVEDVFNENRSRYGHRRVHERLRQLGWQVSKKTVCKLMRQANLLCKVRRKRKFSNHAGAVGTVAPHLLERQFHADAPNQKWVTDITEFKVGEQKLYLSPLMDLFDHQIISHRMATSPNLELSNSMLKEALDRLEPGEAPLVHSDQGFQYRHSSWGELITSAGATQSMSRRGNCYDNAVMENFFGHLKEEVFHHEHYESLEELQEALEEYIAWYNTTRISSVLEGMSPVQYRAHALST